ncbi:MAG: glycosyl hydrolase 53 family protein [Anaerolineae bacterium]|nr:glycosyl hydrolase 53 family protein [Anaerolineae bacterium]
MKPAKNKFLLFTVVALLIVSVLLASSGANGVKAQTTNLLTNPGFESGASQTPSGWSESGTVAASKSDSGGAHSGSYQGTHWRSSAYTVYTYQTKTGLTNGAYTLSAWVKSGGGQTTARMEAKNCGGAQQNYNIPTTNTWAQITISNINVSNSQCTIGFYSVAAANQWINFDDVQFYRNTSGVTSTPTHTSTPGPTLTPTQSSSGLNMRGADVSSLQRALELGQLYYTASSAQQHPLDILQSAGVNYIRLRVWVNPISGYNNMAKVVEFAPQVKSRGLKLLIDLHYSDTWADPGKQYKPAAWNGHTLAQLKTDVYNHTFDVCNALKSAGATPDMIQVGNEITPGLLWEEGRISNNNFANAAALVKEGYNAVKACNSSTLVMLHTDRGGDNASARWWYDGMQAQGVNWDVTGLSYYCFWHGNISAMQSNVADIKSRYNKPVVIVETSYPFTTANGDSATNVITASTPCSGYPASLTGQANFFNDVKTAIKNAGGEGVFWWEATWVGTPGNGWDPANINGTGSEWDNQAVFDLNFRLNPNISWNP